MLVLGLTVLFLVVIAIDFKGLICSSKKTKVIVTYMFLISCAYIISLLQIIDKEPISPTEIISKFIRGVIK